MKFISDLLLTALYTVFVQNLVISSGLGMSEAVRVSSRPGTFIRFAAMISGFSTATSLICALIDRFVGDLTVYAVKAAVYGGVLAAVYIIAAVIVRIISNNDKETLGILGIAALNTLVFAVPYINNAAAYSFAEAIGSGAGAGAAFVIAAALIGSGAKLLEKNENIPEVFKGTPSMFFYVGLISLGFTGFTGKSLF